MGKIVADALDYPFIDSDEVAEETRDCSIAKIFKEEGEEAFRDLESEVLQVVLLYQGLLHSICGPVQPFSLPPATADTFLWPSLRKGSFDSSINDLNLFASLRIQELLKLSRKNRLEVFSPLLDTVSRRMPKYKEGRLTLLQGLEKVSCTDSNCPSSHDMASLSYIH